MYFRQNLSVAPAKKPQAANPAGFFEDENFIKALPSVAEMLKKYQNPQEVDKLLKVQG